VTYQPKIYRKQGAAELVITTSGAVDMDGTMNVSGTIGTSGSGTLAVNSGGTFTMAGTGTVSGTQTVTGTLDIDSATVSWPKYDATTSNTSVDLPTWGFVTLTGSSTNPAWTLDAPTPNRPPLHIYVKSVGNAGSATISSTVDITSGKNAYKADAIGEGLGLSATTTGWVILYNTGSVASTSA